MTLEAITVGREARMMLGSDTYCFGKFQNDTTREIVEDPDVICGDIDAPINRVRKGRKIVRGIIELDPTYSQLVALLPWLGVTTVSSGVYNLGAADVPLEKNCKFDLGGAQHDWSNCIVLGYAFRGSKGGRPVSMQINIEGEDETEAGSSFSDNPLAINKVFSFTDIATRQLDNAGGTLTSRPIDRFLIQVDNRMVSEWNSSITRTGAEIGDRQAVFATSVPYTTTHKDLYWTYRDSEGSVEAKLKLTNSNGNIEFFMPHTVPITKGPSVIGKFDQIRTPVTLAMRRGDNAGTRVSPMTMTLTGP
jgi:hypothetical protein